MASRDVVRRCALPIYFALVFIISWGGGLVVVGPDSLPLDASQFDSLGPLVYLAISDKIVEGSPQNSISSVPIMPWGGR